jgi:dTDP-4-dehydrorhamnose reductase
MKKSSKILIAGSNGMVGSSIVRNLKSKGYDNLLLGSREIVNFTDQNAVNDYFKRENPELAIIIPPAIRSAVMVMPKKVKTYWPIKKEIINIIKTFKAVSKDTFERSFLE